jgi:integrase
MASLEQRGSKFRLVFRYGGQKYQHPLKTHHPTEADECRVRLEENLRLLRRGRLVLPAGSHLPTFLLSDGKLNGPPKVEAVLRLGDLRSRYLESRPEGAWEDNTRLTLEIHFRHLSATFGDTFAVQSLTLQDLQRHVIRRAKDAGLRGRTVCAATVRKEVGTLRAAWTWAAGAGLLAGVFPERGLEYQKSDEKPPFRTMAEVERQVASGALDAAEERLLWDSIYLTLAETAELLDHVRQRPLQPFVYPMACTAAHTGMRRSELLRASVADVDFEAGTLTVQEKKRVKGKRTTRRVPLSPLLGTVLKDWLGGPHPGSRYLFCQPVLVRYGRKGREPGAALTRDEANDHFGRALAGGKFARLSGWHVLRHSFISNLAAAGTDQRLIDEWVGHTTEDMRRRYRHLFPNVQRLALERVFGASA